MGAFIFHKTLYLFCLLSTFIGFSQQDFITGQLLDSTTNEPIVYATVRVKEKNIGVISNLDGSFRIPEEFKDFGSILEISSMGYVSKDIYLFKLVADKTNVIRLAPAVEILDEVVLLGVRETLKKSKAGKKMSAGRIVERAIKNIPLNYSTAPFNAIGYYRDFQLNEKKYNNLNEALFEVWDQGFGAFDFETTKVRVLENKRNIDFPIDTISQKPYDYKNRGKTIPGAHLDNYGGNEFTILRVHDALRNNAINAYDYVNVFKTDFIKNHIFNKEDEVILNNKKLYKISFKKNADRITIKGNLFISQENFAIYKLEYAMYGNQNRRIEKRKRSKNRKQKETLLEIVVGYTPIDGFMYPNYHSMNNNFNVKEPPKFKVNEVHYRLEKRCFVISLNNKANEKDALRRNNYKLKYKDKRISIERIVHIEDEILLFPNPKIETLLFEEMTQLNKSDKKVSSNVNIEIKNIRDIDGNRIHESSYKLVKQYREFFVQRIITKPGVAPNDGLYMNKNVPIFKGQPLARPIYISDYWMNSPLPNIEE